MKTPVLLLCLLISISAFSQQPEIWYFGYNAGVDFSSGSPVSVSGNVMSQWEGVAVACDADGNLEFYSDGLSVWNANNQVMANGTGLLGNSSSTHSATVVPMPGNPDQYYLFTCTDVYSSFGFRYSIVDMTLNGGLGDVTSTKNVLLEDSTTEQCVAICAGNGNVWVLTRQFNPVWFAYKIDATGIEPAVISNAGSVFDPIDANGVGYIKASPLNDKIAIANYGFTPSNSFFEIYDFDDATGVVSNPFQLYLGQSVYGCAFSPDGTKFYGPEWGPDIYQFDLTAGSPTDIANSKTLIGTAGGYNSVGDLQIGPDQKIYCSINGGSYLSVINDPNALGTDCDFQVNGVYLGGFTSGIGLPSTLIFGDCESDISPVALSATDTALCQKFCVGFTDLSSNNPSAWNWIFPGGSPSFSNDQNPQSICYSEAGTYDVTLITTVANGSNDTLTLYDYITVFETPAFPTISQNGYTLTSSPANSYQWQLNATDIPGGTNQSYDVLQTGLYTVIINDENGCANSTTLYVQITGVDEVEDDSFSIYPNPSDGRISVELLNSQMSGEVSVKVVNPLGQLIYSSKENISSLNWKKEFDLSNLARGIYFIELKSQDGFVKKKIIISK